MQSVRIWLLLALFATPVFAWAGGEEVVVVYNSRMPESKRVADHYAAMRHVPPNQIFGFAVTTNEVIPRADFTDFLQKPLAQDLEQAGLWKMGEAHIVANGNTPAHEEARVVDSKIRYAVLCYGIPLKIAPSPMPEPNADKVQIEFRRDEASVDSELVWLPLIKMNVRLTGPMQNLFYLCTNRSMLSPKNGILLVSRLDGPSAAIANGLVDKAMQAEANGLWGRAYIDTRNLATNDAYYLGDVWMRATAGICRQLGMDVDVDTNAATFPESYPMSQIAIYAGWYDGDVSGPFKLPQVEFMPGAFAYHLHSFSAWTLRSTTEHWCGPLLAKGATCTMGCVNEPYLQCTPNVAFCVGALANGFTFGEAAWAAQIALSWQTTVIGDPLYQPFGRQPAEIHAQLSRAKSPLIEWSFEKMVNQDLFHGVREIQLAQFVENLPATAASPVLTEKLAELYETLGKPSSAIDAWQNALKLNPSPGQRVRIRLTLGEKLSAQQRDREALADYQQLLAESPDYPGNHEVRSHIKALEESLASGK